MKRLLLLVTAFVIGWAAQAATDGRQVTNFNFGWRFHAGDVAGAEQPQFDDKDWRTVDVPHDFQIEQPWVAPEAGERADNNDPGANVRSRLSSRAFKEMGIGCTDMGNLTHEFPGLQSYVRVGPGRAHSPEFLAATGSPEAHKGIAVGAKALAMTAVDLLQDPTAMPRIREAFAEMKARYER